MLFTFREPAKPRSLSESKDPEQVSPFYSMVSVYYSNVDIGFNNGYKLHSRKNMVFICTKVNIEIFENA